MRKIFIDCGFYVGLAESLFKKTDEYDDEFEFYAFEPTISEALIEKYSNITFSNKAVWICDGEIDFYKSRRCRGRANSLFPNPRAKKEVVNKIECIDFSKWIMDNFEKDDYIILKMDIEGAEEDVLEKMVKDGSIKYINVAYVEFHSKIKKGYAELKSTLDKLENLDLRLPIERYYKINFKRTTNKKGERKWAKFKNSISPLKNGNG